MQTTETELVVSICLWCTGVFMVVYRCTDVCARIPNPAKTIISTKVVDSYKDCFSEKIVNNG